MNGFVDTKYLAAGNALIDDSRRTRCEVWTRVMGYHRPVSSFNVGKKGEFNERVFFIENRLSSAVQTSEK